MSNTQQGLQNQMFGVFVFLFVIMQLIIQIIPSFVTQRTLYESRERQSKTYAWQAFVVSNIAVEFFWNTVSLLNLMINPSANRISSDYGSPLLPCLVLSCWPVSQR
jgi:ABC-type multidrug transport system permease subunit